jgi:predicted amidohydrolase YtcJ
MDIDKNLVKSLEVQKYASEHVKTNWVKLFMDGTVETGTGFIEPLYNDGHQGIANWEEDEVTYITRKSNEKNLTMHIHTMGNKAVNRVVNAYVNGGKDEMRNTLVHVYSVNQPDYKRMADHNIYVTEGMLWHHNSDDMRDFLMERLPGNMGEEGFPMKSYFDNGVNVTSHSDFPALTGSPDDPFGIIEVAVTGQCYLETGKPRWPEELITREQAITALTINVAKQMFIENERGSIKTGKYADFHLIPLLLNSSDTHFAPRL